MNATTLSHTKQPQSWLNKTGSLIPGLLLAGAIAAVATWAAQFPIIRSNGLSALTLGALTNGASVAQSLLAGVSFPIFDGGARRARPLPV